ncbi:TIR domain-containing protein [Sphingomonas rosea]|uniref:TIR domain-containing protein n=1 Tax=Sphingomonas rosea TaxID=335605 RepID=A0ABP7U474_9SPHN
MAYRNGTYIAFHAEGKTDPTASDIRYYRMMKAWHENDDIDFKFINSHDKVEAVKDSASKSKIKQSLEDRLDNSKNMVLIVGPKTHLDTDFVPHEIEYAVDVCGIPVIVVYTGYTSILNPASHRHEWPAALTKRIDDKSVCAIHIPFKQKVIDTAIRRFDLSTQPNGPLSYYTKEAQQKMGVEFK